MRGEIAVAVLALFGAVQGARPQAVQPDDEWTVAAGSRSLALPNVLPNSPALVKSLGDAAEYVLRWQPPASAAAWNARRPEVERAFRAAIGLDPLPERSPLQARVTARHDRDGYTIENIIFYSRPGFPVTANLYRPKAAARGKRAAILCPIGHYLSAGKTAPDVQARCAHLARMGFVVLVYDAIGQGERMVPGNIHHEAGYALLPLGETVAGWMVWDSMRAIDYLLTLEDVDPERIGVTGNSGGGLNTLFTAALDSRVRAAAVVGYTFEFNNWIKYAGAHCTCTHLPGLFRGMEWFEIAGLIAPRGLLMLQGDSDNIFPISGARRAGHATGVVYTVTGHAEAVRFDELAGQPHAYSRPYRERMYGWMASRLLGQGRGEPIAEGDARPFTEMDRALLCDPEGASVRSAPTVVDLARSKALRAVAELPSGTRTAAASWVREFTAPPEERPHYLAPQSPGETTVRGGKIQKLSFASEDGAYIPGLLWLPEQRTSPARTVIVVNGEGKRAVAESGLVQPLVDAGFAVFSVDLRGRGETLESIRGRWNTNFRLVANQVLFGQPLAGRRAFDLKRAVDYLESRNLASGGVALAALGDDALPAALAAASDTRIRSVALAGYFHSFVSQMRAMRQPDPSRMGNGWNDAQLDGRLTTADYQVEFGSVIPSALKTLDVPDILALIAPRKVLFCQARDAGAPDAEVLVRRFEQVTGAAGAGWIRYEPGRALDGGRLLEWLGEQAAP